MSNLAAIIGIKRKAVERAVAELTARGAAEGWTPAELKYRIAARIKDLADTRLFEAPCEDAISAAARRRVA